MEGLSERVGRNVRHLRQARAGRQADRIGEVADEGQDRRRRYTKESLAARLGVDVKTWTKIENGGGPVGVERLEHLALLLDVSPLSLLLPAPGDDPRVLVGRPPHDQRRLSLGRYLNWWWGLRAAPGQDRRAFHESTFQLRNEIEVADMRHSSEEVREGVERQRQGRTVTAQPITPKQVLPGRPEAMRQLQSLFDALEREDWDSAEVHDDHLTALIATAYRRAEGVPQPEVARFRGRVLTATSDPTYDPEDETTG